MRNGKRREGFREPQSNQHNDHHRPLNSVITKPIRHRPHWTERPDPAAEEEVAARLAGHLRGINCPPDYWAKQADTEKDVQRFYTGNEPLASCDEAIRLRARLIVFDGSPDGAAWRRMMELSYRKRNRAQQAELEELRRCYPGMPLQDYDPSYETIRHMEEVVRELGPRGRASKESAPATDLQTLYGNAYNATASGGRRSSNRERQVISVPCVGSVVF